MRLNHPELVHKHAANLVSPVKIKVEKVRHSQTTPEFMWMNSTHLTISEIMWFEKVPGGSLRFSTTRN